MSARTHVDTGSDLTVHTTVVELIAIYEKAEADIKAGFALVHGAEESLSHSFSSKGYDKFIVKTVGRHPNINFKRPEECFIDLRRQVWFALIERLELRRCMSIKAWKKLEKDIKEGEAMAITVENVMAMATQFRSALPQMLEEAVVEVYNWLRPRRDIFKTNSQYKVGKRVILEFVVDPTWSDHWDVRCESQQHLTALENVFTALDGRGQVTRGAYSDLHQAMRSLPKDQTVGETEYFRFKCYKRGTLHLEFKRMDLVLRFNEIAGKGMLKNKSEK